MTRHQELAAGLVAAQERIAAACDLADRDPGEVTLVVVTKFFPAADVVHLLDLGVRDFGESRHQEAVEKTAEVRRLVPGHHARWHFIGNLQSNKAAAVGAYADVVHSVDRAKLLAPLGRAALARDVLIDVLVQVDLDPEPVAGRGGVRPELADDLAEQAAATRGLRLRGVMGVAPLGGDPDPAFERLAEVAARIRSHDAGVGSGADWISAGMSGDLEAAIKRGATHVRVGSAILGSRPSHG
ncbi:MAG: YggS family pyridoxal phosphate-dependent enzyme [Nocardioidaceae bacterium]